MNKSLNDLERWADTHETSLPVAKAIFEIARSDNDAQKIWEDPTGSQMKKIKTMINTDAKKWDGKLKVKSGEEMHWGEESFRVASNANAWDNELAKVAKSLKDKAKDLIEEAPYMARSASMEKESGTNKFPAMGDIHRAIKAVDKIETYSKQTPRFITKELEKPTAKLLKSLADLQKSRNDFIATSNSVQDQMLNLGVLVKKQKFDQDVSAFWNDQLKEIFRLMNELPQ